MSILMFYFIFMNVGLQYMVLGHGRKRKVGSTYTPQKSRTYILGIFFSLGFLHVLRVRFYNVVRSSLIWVVSCLNN